ncbi:integrase arm-type DNA-binding domain-containing protein [Pseudomonas costantinii]|uniref:integrase arm-type DNA-binding domain-containing protein n=1 Tax=Pseudomonas costantinii TaxID=168469 RepID=UPI0015A279E0|nr:integrase arm-type DNA-binding domain-containing protein [Pseudomonas costantinii]
MRHARTTGKNYTLGDFDGLSLWVTKLGGKLWLFRYYWEGSQQRMSFGAYPEISLKQARARRDEARRLSADNISPCEHRKQQRHEVEIAVKQTFEAVYSEWVSLKEGR